MLAGYCNRAPKNALTSVSSRSSPTTISIPSGSARVRSTSRVCGWQWLEAKNAWLPLFLLRRLQKVMASAAAVASSSSEALAIGRPVRSLIRVWKFSSASRRPWEISGWYGV
ncbi:hypothetical protein D3C76_847080 [compost metagenome]